MRIPIMHGDHVHMYLTRVPMPGSVIRRSQFEREDGTMPKNETMEQCETCLMDNPDIGPQLRQARDTARRPGKESSSPS